MTSERNGNGTKINLKTVYWVVGIMVGFLTIWILLSNNLDSKVATKIVSNEKIVTMDKTITRIETEQKNYKEQMDRMESMLKEMRDDLREHKRITER